MKNYETTFILKENAEKEANTICNEIEKLVKDLKIEDMRIT